jgi:hypothetical protein
MGRFNYDRAAAVLVEAAYYGDKAAAERNGVSVRSVENYRARLEDDIELVAIFAIKKQQFDESWADELPGAIRAGIQFLAKAAREADPKDAQTIYSMAGALKILADVTLTKRVLDARLTGRGEPEREENRQMATASANEYADAPA